VSVFRRKSFWIICLIALSAIWFNLPSPQILPDQLKIIGWSINLAGLKQSTLEIHFAGRRYQLDGLALGNLIGRYPLKLGLDLQGGTELVLQTEMDKIPSDQKDAALQSARSVIERRVNLYGVSESSVQSSRVGDARRILVELPGVKDLETAVSLVGKTAQLEFWELDPKVAEATTSASIKDFKPTSLTGSDLKKASVTFGASRAKNSSPQVAIEFTDTGGQKFADITKRNINRPLAMMLDGVPISWPPPIVQQEIIGGNAVISGSFTADQAKNLSVQLNAGALPVPIKILQQRTIAATLGAESIRKSLVAGVIGIGVVMGFMISYYGLYGLLADLALILYGLIVLAIFRTGGFIIPPVTLTLAGIAGFILSIGMALDANILTFERMKEERRFGKSGKLVLEHGFARAWTSIRDSNLASLITALILFIFGTSVVRGFSLTLAIGVLVSMFSAVVVTRSFLRMLPRFKR